MIDLRYSGLPDTIEVGGESYHIHTGWRLWLAWLESVEVNGVAETCIFDGDVPPGDSWVQAAMDFATCPEVTPRRQAKANGRRAYDLVRDGSYLVGAYQQAYGIDLTSPACDDMHWWRFLALMRSLPADTTMSRIIGCRTWRKAGKVDWGKEQARMRDEWALPDKHTAADDDAQAWLDEAFGD